MNESAVSTVSTNVEGAGQGIAATSNNELLPLDLPERVVVLKMRDGGGIRRHVFRRLDRADVDCYFQATVVATQRTGQTTENEIDIGSAELALYARCIVHVEGYRLEDGRDLMTLPNWRERVPGAARIRATDLLMKVDRSACSGEQLLNANFDVISLDSCWTAKEDSMSFYRGLLHRFTPPTNSDWRKFNNFRTRSVAVPGSRTQKTLYPKMDGILIALYDSLISEVAGYSFAGAPLTDQKKIILHMDAFHKISAMAALFDKSEFDYQDEEAEQK